MHSIEILKKKVAEKRNRGEKLLCSPISDEMAIRKNVQWCDKTKKMLGYVDLGDGENNSESVAEQALVFMMNAINDSFQIPIATFFIDELNAGLR